MRAVRFVILVLVVIVIGWGLIYNFVEKNTSEFINNLDDLSKKVENNDWEGAKIQFYKIEKKWDKAKNTWSIILDHHEIDNIDLSIAKASKYIKTQDSSLSLGEIEVLRKLFGIVRENEALTITNIF
ncbi:DUF4363 family protein [Caldisalinibacter kiritimatiensis]|uniref:DUF4363 family protein n=1 Tax=Caldisalinibacter kiritimatiensis TaxID=1304284 RepID=R1CBB6_9FIRM|nr:DUF4363 family protein [Caldisalinibacter kiritimatiensis]EOC99604.1 hypothetical protein L21TH_2377 [Caldisalinibacter kiritimatiensis]